ncbi:MAG: hypothetical protein ABUT39_09560 [Acidobacteriota bacterium]
MRRRLSWLILALAALSSPVFGAEAARLVSPADGAELLAGSEMTLEWTGSGLPGGVEEWEAFLSLDGGRTWPLRITPHLDISIRRFSFRVPAFPTRDARLLLRFGDESAERDELELEMPQRLAISGDLRRDSLPVVLDLAAHRGERARPDDPDDPGTVVWIEGSRDGNRLREVVALDPVSSFEEARPAGRLFLAMAAPGPARTVLAEPALSSTEAAPAPRPALGEAPAPRSGSVPVRLLIRRFNE